MAWKSTFLSVGFTTMKISIKLWQAGLTQRSQRAIKLMVLLLLMGIIFEKHFTGHFHDE